MDPKMDPNTKVRYQRLEQIRSKVPESFRTDAQKQVGINRIVRAVILEYLATALFVFYACGSVVASNVYIKESIATVAQNVFAALVQGFAIAMLVYAIAHTSGGHINPAVTLSMVISGNLGAVRGLFYILAQMAGGITGAALLSGFLPGPIEGTLGTTTLGQGLSPFQGYLFEFFITFALLFTIFGTALNKEAAASGTSSLAPLPIGFSILVGVGIAYQFTGGSMNPARTFGPALISGTWSHHYIYWFGPFTAAILVGLLERFFALFSQGQHAVFRAVAIRKRKEIREAANRRPSALNAVPVVLEPGAEPVNMVPILDPENPNQAIMVPIATAEQLEDIVDMVESQIPNSNPNMNAPGNAGELTSTPQALPGAMRRRKSVLPLERRRSQAPQQQVTFAADSPRGQGAYSSPKGFTFKRKYSLVPPAPLSDFGYLSDESISDLHDIPAVRPPLQTTTTTTTTTSTSSPAANQPGSPVPVVTVVPPNTPPVSSPKLYKSQ